METQTFSERIEKLKLESIKLADVAIFGLDNLILKQAEKGDEQAIIVLSGRAY